jgi:nicotinate-nucleotide pyrophosphorylase (carboxylating)
MTLEELVRAALSEDIGPGDWTTRLLVPPELIGSAQVISKANGVLSGLKPFGEVFRLLDSSLRMHRHFSDGDDIAAGDVVLKMEGKVAAILTGERTALNFLQRLTGIATLTRKYVESVRGTKAVILDTRKTTPLWRSLEKEAVRHGGGANHRSGLFDMILIKENHEAAAGGLAAAVQRAKQNQKNVGIHSPLAIEVEIQKLEQLDKILPLGVDRIMLDNFSLQDIREAVQRVNGIIPVEVSGGVTLDDVRQIALCGVDFISVGALTHSAPAHDFSLLVNP